MSHKSKTSDISDQDYQTLVNDFNANKDISLLGKSLVQLFEKIVEVFPDNIALIHNKTKISFKELNASANLLARGLSKRGLRQGDVFGLAVSRSIDLVVTMLAVLKLGAAYVPIDPTFPAKRIDQMVQDAECKLILLSDDCLTEESLARWQELCLSVSVAKDSSITDITNLEIGIKPQDLAYIIYTSGSTGTPKGVEISHGAAANFLSSLRKYEPGCDEHDRLLAITTISFDMSTLELLLPLISGCTMIVANESAVRDPREIISLIQSHQVTILQATPATWTMLLESGWGGNPRLSKIICGGEPLSRQLADRLLASAESVWNVYGPCETTYGSIGRVGNGEIVVGKPIANGRIYVLDDNMSPVPMGREGEVYIGGGSVSNGYRNKPELTNSRFFSNPFHDGRFFRTGDLARFIGPGKLQVIGRSDGVIKIRGHRIDVGDIEAALLKHVNVSEAVVTSHDDRLVAYCVARLPYHSAISLSSILRPWVAERLPSYMVPTFFVPIDALPLSPNRKVNRKALPNPVETMQIQLMAQPTSELEQIIQKIWSEVLGHDRISIEDNFFNIGGDSVRIIRAQTALEKQLHRPVSTPKLFEHYTIKRLAAYLAGTGTEINKQESHAMCNDFIGNYEDIAIVSMACRLPGGVLTPEDFWQLLASGVDAIIDVPKDRWDADRLYHADPGVDGASYCNRGGFLDSIYSYDTSFFGISPREAQAMDPAQHLMLELCWESFERAGYTQSQLSGSTTGVFLGVSNNGASNSIVPDLKGYSITGSAGATMSGRLSYTLNLQGPCLTVDTACSSSLVATHLACNALRQGECNMALAGGISLLLTPGIHVEFSKLRALSTDGRCKAFSEDTDGTGFSEGAAVMVLKRLSDAQRDGDDIHAVLRGTAVMHGGNSAGLTVPNGPGQEVLIRTALARAAIEPCDVDYIEAHGTATKLGDPIEATALARVYGVGRQSSAPVRIGSAKSNIGHTQAAAGLVGLLKVVLSLQNNVLPQTLHVSEPTRAVDWKSSNMELVLASRSWLPDNSRMRRAGVSAFGIGGTNAHIIVEESPVPVIGKAGSIKQPAFPAEVLFVLSAKSNSALRAQAGKLQSYLKSGIGKNNRLIDVAYSLAISRTHFDRRLVVAARDKPQMLKKLASISSGTGVLPHFTGAENASLGMLFTGQGNQQPGTGQDLYSVYPVFRNTLDRQNINPDQFLVADCPAQFMELEFPLLDIMWPKFGSAIPSLSDRTDLAQPALFALEVSLWRLWQSWGVKPAFLLGHSVGELAVAHVSGIIDLPDACRLVMMRGRLMQAVTYRGKMASIEASSAEVVKSIQKLGMDDRVEVAGYNTPSQTVISGDGDAVEAVVAHMIELSRKTKVLQTSRAFHSFHMNSVMDDFKAIAQAVRFSPPKIPVISSMTGRLAKAGELERAEYWVQQARNPVRFSDAFQTIVDAGANVFLELGPSPTLCGLGAACLADASRVDTTLWLPSLKPDINGSSVIQNSIGSLHLRKVWIDWAAYFKPFGCQKILLPTYAFQRTSFQPASRNIWFGGISEKTKVDESTQGVQKMMFEMNWRQIDKGKAQPSCGLWGLLCPPNETPWTIETQKILSNTGIRVLSVTTLQEALPLGGLLCLWDYNNANDITRIAHRFTTKALAQLQEVIRTGFDAPVVWVTRLAVGTGHGDRPVQIGSAPLWGLMRTARSEHPDLPLRLIDVDDTVTEQNQALSLALMMDDQAEIAVRKEQLLSPHLERTSLAALRPIPNPTPLLRVDGAVLVAGGLGDLASHIACRLVSAHGVRDLVLMSRRGMESPGADALVGKLAKLGAKTTVVGGDIANVKNVQSVMEIFTADRPLRGVIHAAGVVDSGILTSLTPEKCATTFAPKVNGLWNLHQLTKENKDLDLFVMLSSISGVMGLPGLGNYAAANCFIDVLAYMRRAQGLPATSVAYGTWDGNGMATTLFSATRTHLSQLGLGFLAPEAGLELFEQAVYQGRTLTVAAELDLERLKVYHGNHGGVPPFLRSMLGKIDVMEPVERTVNLRDRLANAATEQHGSIMLHTVRVTIAKALGYDGIDDLDAGRPLKEFGVDSLTAILIRNQLAAIVGIALPPNIALLHRNLKSLSEFLLSKLLDDIGSDTSSAPEDNAMITTTSSGYTYVDMSAVQKGILSPSIQFNNVSEYTATCSGHPNTVFVTGPTGFVGAFMVYEFLKRGIHVYCLVRASGFNQAQERMVTALKQYSLWNPIYEPLLKSVVGDLSLPFLGLNEAVFEDLSNRVEAILHSGALVDWMRPLEAYIGPNVFGTQEVLRLASCGRNKAVHFISTISTLPIHLGYGIDKYDGEYGYGTSKYLAEKLIVAARFRGAKAFSYRLPFVAASATNGHFRLDRGDFLNNLISGSLDLGVFPSIDADLSAVLPVDYLCNTIATIMTEDQHRVGEDYDFLNPHAPSFDQFFHVMGTASGGKTTIPFSEWRRQALEYAIVHPKSSLARIATIIDGYTDESVGRMMKSLPVSRNLLGLESYPAPQFSEGYVHQYLACILKAKSNSVQTEIN